MAWVCIAVKRRDKNTSASEYEFSILLNVPLTGQLLVKVDLLTVVDGLVNVFLMVFEEEQSENEHTDP